MTPAEFRAGREQLDLTQSECALLFRVKSDRTIRKWEDGENDIAGPAIVLMRLLLDLPAARKAVGLKMPRKAA